MGDRDVHVLSSERGLKSLLPRPLDDIGRVGDESAGKQGFFRAGRRGSTRLNLGLQLWRRLGLRNRLWRRRRREFGADALDDLLELHPTVVDLERVGVDASPCLVGFPVRLGNPRIVRGDGLFPGKIIIRGDRCLRLHCFP
ncbi:hypothetical protein LCGC14_3129200 [marine sediment metagenome]|uniref:Uncharacterized protein n=1 Tax=marine sediment metagenome TaxID=412755 RepID=A0A0F8Y797_9ZZZZ